MEFRNERQQLVEIVKELYREKLITPAGGNISVRLPADGRYLITPSGMHKGSLHPNQLVEVDIFGKPKEESLIPSVETPMHLKIYETNQDINAIIHSHAPYATIMGLYGNDIPPLSLGAVCSSDLTLVPFCMPGSKELVEKVAAVLKQKPEVQAVLLQNHGLLACGSDLRSAANTSMTLEEICHMVVTCKMIGGAPAEIPEKYWDKIRQYGLL